MTRGLKFAVLIVVFAAQFAAPAWMLGKREWVLHNGAEYKFRTAPVDPYDAFRGRYVALSLEQSTVDYADPNPAYGKPLYATLAVDDKGFAKFDRVSETPPASGDFIKIDTWYAAEQGKIQLFPPFDRYYMNETLAPAAEQAYREHSRASNRDAYITVRILNGYTVLDGLYFGEQRIEDFLKNGSTAETAASR